MASPPFFKVLSKTNSIMVIKKDLPLDSMYTSSNFIMDLVFLLSNFRTAETAQLWGFFVHLFENLTIFDK